MPKFLAHIGMVNVQATLQLVVAILTSDILTKLSQQSVPFGTANLDPMQHDPGRKPDGRVRTELGITE
jgi:hypothetical protein